ncbi:structural protein MipA [Altererythrobacter sp. B11]|uniref:MipA/OmpV family protein n=1 Tax=Altererythrobacter sp. B11 TaxID=2060312 RepID=UPI000DC6D9EE|nr:MipA/OmpV family protein [Altererythrobacter sp. B11]BBC74357.1 structural protein MipA [Altererythrobacter sp. B11]
MKSFVPLLGSALALAIASPACAQDSAAREDTVFDGDYLSVGVGAAVVPSYDGSDDYVVSPVPLVQGSIKGVGINPRAAGLALDFVPDAAEGPGFNLGVAGRLRLNRTRQIKDPVVKSLGELDTAVEVGPTAGVRFPGVLNPYDSLTVTTDVLWDVAGAHDGMVVNPSIAYFTPLSRGMAATLSLNAEYGDDSFADYYYSITPGQSLASGLPAYQADGGFTKAGASLLMAYDLDGELANGGLALFAVGSYSRMLGDAKDSPIVSIRGSANQWAGAIGIGYTF